MVLAHPFWLVLLVVVPVLLWQQRRWHRGVWRGRDLLVAALRVLAVVLMVGALTRPMVMENTGREKIVAVVDISASVSAESLAKVESELAGIAGNGKLNRDAVLVSDRAELAPVTELARSGELMKRQKLAASRGADETALADGLMRAGAMIKPNERGRVVLWSDGFETRDDAAAEAHRLADRGVEVETRGLIPAMRKSVAIGNVQVPAAAGVGSRVAAKVHVVARDAQQATIRVVGGSAKSEGRTVALTAGDNEIDLPVMVAATGANVFDVEVESASGELARGKIAVMGLSPPRVLVVEKSGRRFAADALAKVLGASAEVTTAGAENLERADVDAETIVLANLPAAELSRVAQENLRRAVASGKGLLLTGGPESFGPGGYGQSELAELIPLSLNQQEEKPDPSVALVVIIDTSASMAGARIGLAKEVVRLTMRRMSPHDKIGIVEFYGSKRWAAPIQPASNSIELNRALNRLTAGGGTLIFPALEEAFFALKTVNARSKHVLILTDGGVETGPFEMITRRMAENGMTVSTVLTGPGQHSNFLASLAQWGRGHFYQTPDQFSLPEIMLKQPSSQMQSAVVERATRVVAAGQSNVTRQVDVKSAPAIAGYVRAGIKPTAETLLQTQTGDPILTSWRFGRGRVAAFTSSVGGAWTKEWLSSPAGSVVMANLVRSVSERPARERVNVELRQRAAGLQVSARAMGDAGAVNETMTIAIQDLSGKDVRTLIADPIEPGVWDVLVRDLAAGEYQVKLLDESGAMLGSAAVAIHARGEFVGVEANQNLLQALSAQSRKARDFWAQGRAIPGGAYREIWLALAVASLMCLLGNVLARRWPAAGLGLNRTAKANRERLMEQPKEQYV